MLKLVSLAGQRFMRMVLHDALQVCKRRVKAEEVSAAAKAKKDAKSRRETVGAWALTSEDVSNALREYGINNNVPPFFLQNEGAWLI